MKLTWLGHACFKMQNQHGVSVITDPFDETVGYDIPYQSADIVTCSHDHFDHNYTAAVKGHPIVINTSGDFDVKGIHIKGISCYHDDAKGAKRGENIAYVYDMDFLRICHLGDLGHILTHEQVAQIGKVDVLLMPVGGIFTIDAKGAVKVMDMITPKLVIPMHYNTSVLSFSLDKVDKFLDLTNFEYIKSDRNWIDITRDNIDTLPKILVLDYKND